MGLLAHFDVGALVARHGLLHFVETGVGRGQGLAHACRFPFRTLRSCDVEPSLAAAAASAFAADDRVTVYAGPSPEFLRRLCNAIPADEPVLFWLDAHFPGADYGLAGYGAHADETVRLPLPAELAAIASGRPAGRDVVLVDDLRVWIDGAFGSGNLPASVRPFCPKRRDASFFEAAFGATHMVAFDWADEGYVTVMPRTMPAFDDDPAARAEVEADA